MSDATFPCPVCGAQLPGRAKFCAECGSPVRAPGAAASGAAATGDARSNTILPWFIAGVSVIAIQTLALILALRPPPGPLAAVEPDQRPAAQGAPLAGGSGRATTDISSLTPRQAA